MCESCGCVRRMFVCAGVFISVHSMCMCVVVYGGVCGFAVRVGVCGMCMCITW